MPRVGGTAERKSPLFLFCKAPNRIASDARWGIEGLLTPIKDFVQNLTYDIEKECCYHADTSATLEAQKFFAHPDHHSWEGGLRELQWPFTPKLPHGGKLGLGQTR